MNIARIRANLAIIVIQLPATNIHNTRGSDYLAMIITDISRGGNPDIPGCLRSYPAILVDNLTRCLNPDIPLCGQDRTIAIVK